MAKMLPQNPIATFKYFRGCGCNFALNKWGHLVNAMTKNAGGPV